jgi:hypothetical protein
MLRTNLSTRPFYNERAIHALAALAAIAVLAVTAWQVVRVVRLSRYKTELNTAIARDRNETDASAREAATIRRGLDQKQLSVVAAAATEANDLIAQRTFSWTQLFNELEATLPDDVMLISVHPEIKDGITQLHMDVQGKAGDVIDAFWERLEKTGQFRDVVWSSDTITEEGLHRVAMKVIYTPTRAAARPAGVAR